MLYTLFFSRWKDLDPAEQADYETRSNDLLARAKEEHPGFVDIKSFVSEDGERLTVVRFRDEESQRRWRRDAVHAEAQSKGRADFYAEYRIVICEEVRSHEWRASSTTIELD